MEHESFERPEPVTNGENVKFYLRVGAGIERIPLFPSSNARSSRPDLQAMHSERLEILTKV